MFKHIQTSIKTIHTIPYVFKGALFRCAGNLWAILRMLSIDVWTPLDAASGSRDVAHRSRWLHSWGFTSNWSNSLSARNTQRIYSRNTRYLPQALRINKEILPILDIHSMGGKLCKNGGNTVHTFTDRRSFHVWHSLGSCFIFPSTTVTNMTDSSPGYNDVDQIDHRIPREFTRYHPDKSSTWACWYQDTSMGRPQDST